MSVQEIIDVFLGKMGARRINCAQAVAAALAQRVQIPAEQQSTYVFCGGGKAPGGLCGALYAAEDILRLVVPDALESCRSKFAAVAGGVRCSDVRRLKKASCAECVKLVVATLEEILPRP